MATSSNDRTVKIWNPNTNWTLIRTLTNHSSQVWGIEWINEDTFAPWDQTIQIWSITNRTINVGNRRCFIS